MVHNPPNLTQPVQAAVTNYQFRPITQPAQFPPVPKYMSKKGELHTIRMSKTAVKNHKEEKEEELDEYK